MFVLRIGQAVLGYAEESEAFGCYSKGCSVKQFKRAINKITYI
ncbi:hypothetical protein VCR20J5_1240172 [Vibrio crassostreae]|nr:hypothetical protein VCR20J5_1240172 [Vibrio crassostreae]